MTLVNVSRSGISFGDAALMQRIKQMMPKFALQVY
jgi:hypothetical protein